MSIQLLSRRGPIGKGWHAVALRDAAELILGVGRAGHGKTDARAGRVQWLDVQPGIARGDVLDADGEMYQARLDLPTFSPGDREAFLDVARARPELPARMASGEYPQAVEAELARSEVSLLPRSASELSHDCSCLDWPGPCRHVAALVYVLVEAVDASPVLLLTLRGLALEDLVAPAPSSAPVAGEHEADDLEDTGAGPRPGPYDASLTTPDLLAEVIGDGPAGIIAGFYGSRAGVDRPSPDPASGDR